MACPRCRKKPPPGAAFCPKCGASLKPSARPQHPAGIDPDLQAIARTAARLCEANDAVIHLVEGDQARFVARHGRLKTILRLGEVHPLTRDRIGHIAILERRTIHVRDLTKSARAGFAESRAALAPVGVRTVLATPLLHDGAAIGSILIRRTKVRPFTPKQIALLEAFAQHAATAIEKTRLAQVLTEALEQQTATSEILRVIAGSPTTLDPVLDAVVKTAARLCEANNASLYRVEGDLMRKVAGHGSIRTTQEVGDTRPVTRGSVTGRAILERRTLHIPDLLAEVDTEYPVARDNVRREGIRTFVATPLLREGVSIGTIAVYRTEARPFSDKQIALLRTFADQAVIAIENVRLFTELQERNLAVTQAHAQVSEALEQQTATSEILRVIASSPTDLQPVMDAVVSSAARLCGAYDAGIFRRDGDSLELVAHNGLLPASIGLRIPLVRGTTTGRSVLERQTIHVPDVQAETEDFPEGSVLAKEWGHRAILNVPLMREGVAIGTIQLRRAEANPFTDKQIRLLETFADQAVIAIENVRLFKELEARNRDLSVALDRQTATSEILRVIGSSPTDAQPVFDAIVRSAVRLLGGFSGTVTRLVGDDVHLAAITSTSESGDDAIRGRFPRPLADAPLQWQAIRERAPVIVTDIEVDLQADDDMRRIARARGYRSMLNVPIVREDTPIGVISVARREPGPFAAEEIALLQTFADQAVIAIENVRLFKELEARNTELTEGLERETATGEILRVISSSPTDIQPVLATVVKSAARLCDAYDAQIFQREGDQLLFVAHHGPMPSGPVGEYTVPLVRGTINGRSVLEGLPVHVADVQAERDEFPEGSEIARRYGHRTVLSLPLMREGVAIGTISVRRTEIRPFTERQISLLKTFADQAVIAIENVRLFKELEARNRDLSVALDRQTATSEILRVIGSSPTDAQPVFDAIATSAVRLLDGFSGAVLRLVDDDIHLVALTSTSDVSDEAMRVRYPRPLADTPLSAQVVRERAPYMVSDTEADPLADEAMRQVARARSFRSQLQVPMLREGAPIGTIAITRREPGPFAAEEIALLQTFADQAVIAIENVRLFKELEARNADLTEALEQQTATSEILRVISSSPTSVEAVFDTILASALRLCDTPTGGIFTFDGQAFHIAAAAHWSEQFLAALREAVILPGPETPLRRVGLNLELSHVADIFADPSFSPPATYRLEGMRTSLAVPMLKEGRLVGALTFHRREVRPFTENQIALIKTFADQAVIAIENVRLFKELEARNRDLTEALEQQTATSEILRVISSSPNDVEPVLAAIAASAAQLCGATDALIHRVEGDRIRRVAHVGTMAVAMGAETRPVTRDTPSGRAIVERRIVHVHDILEEFARGDYLASRGLQEPTGFRTILVTPLVLDEAVIGVITIRRAEVRPFTAKQIELVKTFADQAVIAIENVRLFTELEARNRDLTEGLERETATSQILRVISGSPTDVQPVFETILDSATRLCAAENGILFQYDGGAFHTLACRGLSPEAEAAFRAQPARPGPQSGLGRMLAERRPVHIADVTDDIAQRQGDPLRARTVSLLRARTAMWLPLLKTGVVVGAMAIYRHDVRPFTTKQIELVSTFADQAVIAIENVRLFKELEARNRDLTEALEQQTATAEVLRVISTSPTNLQRVLDTVATSAARFCGAYDAAMFRLDGEGLRLAAHHGPISVAADRGVPVVPGTVSGRSVLKRQAVHVADVLAQAEEFPESSAIARDLGFRTMLSVPLLREGAAIGTIGLRRSEVNPFTDKQIKLLQTFADQAVIAIENARLFTELQARTTELTRSVEQLTALGEVSRAVSSTLDVETVLQTVVSRARQLASADGCLIYEYDEGTQQFHVRATDNLDAEFGEAMGRMPIRKGEGVSGRAAELGEPVQVADITQPGIYDSSVRGVVIRAGYRAALSVPLLREDEIIGSLILIRKTPGEFSAEVVEALKTFATQSALAIQNARLFREIEEKGRQLEIASRHKSQFLANMSHELRTPLNAILGYTELLQDGIYGQIPDKAQETMQRVDRSGRHLLALINDVLDLSKIEAGQLTLSLGDYSLKEVVQTVVTALEPLAAEKRLALTVTVSPDLPVGRGDDRRLSQVLLNLVGNAVKFTDAGEVRVEAKASDGTFLVSVSDTGPGIAAEDQARIFEEFQQVDTSSTRKKGGTGLGLAIAKRILALHGGRIWVESAPGKGSTFFFTLPVRVERMAEVT